MRTELKGNGLRLGLERCLEELREGDTLVVWRLDRFGLPLKDLVSMMETLEEQGVDFVSLTEGIDTTTAQGRLTFHIFGALAECERFEISKATLYRYVEPDGKRRY